MYAIIVNYSLSKLLCVHVAHNLYTFHHHLNLQTTSIVYTHSIAAHVSKDQMSTLLFAYTDLGLLLTLFCNLTIVYITKDMPYMHELLGVFPFFLNI